MWSLCFLFNKILNVVDEEDPDENIDSLGECHPIEISSFDASFQDEEQLPTDQVRVDMLFRKALDEGINIQFRSINETDISKLILSGKYIAIALVDQYKLSKSWLEDVILSSYDVGNSSYAGHYVVICGYDAGADEFEIRDPATSRKYERISSKNLEEARKSFGTDEDLLLISLENREAPENLSAQPIARF